jgi:hypothetical protein
VYNRDRYIAVVQALSLEESGTLAAVPKNIFRYEISQWLACSSDKNM